jgi:transcriptional regulator with XRE-family HTH domain
MLGFELFANQIDMEDFAERLRSLRTARGLTQTRLAELLGMPARSYNRWERGGHVPHLAMAIKIAEILRVSLDELVGRTNTTSEVAIRNADLHQLVQEVDVLPDDDQRALITVMDGLVKKAQFNKLMQQRIGASRSRNAGAVR